MTHNYGHEIGNLHIIDYYLYLATCSMTFTRIATLPRNQSFCDLDAEEEIRDGWAYDV